MMPENAEMIVRERYPNAVIKHHEAVYEMGQKKPIQQECWDVYPACELGQKSLGTGPTAEAAWVAASTKVLEGVRKSEGFRIKRQDLNDIEMSNVAAMALKEMIEDALTRGDLVIVKEINGSESLLVLENGELVTKPN